MIESKIIDFNLKYYKKAQNTIVFQEKIYLSLQSHKTRDKIIAGTLEWDNYNIENVFKLL